MKKENKKFLLFLLIVFIILCIEFILWIGRGKALENAYETPEEEIIEIIPLETPTTTSETETTIKNTAGFGLGLCWRPTPTNDVPLNIDDCEFIYEQCGYDDDLYCFVTAVMKHESNFDFYAVSEDGHDFGIMQLRDTYHDEWEAKFDVPDATLPLCNITIGVGLLKEYLEKYEYKNLALMCYNNGPTGAKELWSQGIYSTDYTRKVLNTYNAYLEENRPSLEAHQKFMAELEKKRLEEEKE